MASYPQLNEEFKLELDADAPENSPIIGMVQVFAEDSAKDPDGWRFTGTLLAGKLRGRFKLIRIDFEQGVEAAKAKFEAQGSIPAGQWMQAFIAAYPKSDGNGSVAIPDASWISPRGLAYYPCVGWKSKPHFSGACRGIGGEDQRFIVAVPDTE